jgi:hypothetical protein
MLAVCLIGGTNSPKIIARAAYPPHQIAEDGGAGVIFYGVGKGNLSNDTKLSHKYFFA